MVQVPAGSAQADSVILIPDTVSVCTRSRIGDLTFYDSSGLAYRIKTSHTDDFPFVFTGRNMIIALQEKASLEQQLRPGSERPFNPLHEDWILLIIIAGILLFTMTGKSSAGFQHSVRKFFLFRGISDPASKDIGAIFNWESTIINLVSFLTLGLFGYCAAAYQDLLPAPLPGIAVWLICVLVIAAAITVRHLVCVVTGAISDERDLFMEYMVTVYQSYRFAAILLFVITILMLYTHTIPAGTCLIAGTVILSILYMFRILRLFIIFINKNISIFYLILYLCALEFLPVVIIVKYVSGLV